MVPPPAPTPAGVCCGGTVTNHISYPWDEDTLQTNGSLADVTSGRQDHVTSEGHESSISRYQLDIASVVMMSTITLNLVRQPALETADLR